MPGTGLIDAAAPAPSLWALLTGLGGRHRLKLALTYALTLVENGLNVLYPYLRASPSTRSSRADGSALRRC